MSDLRSESAGALLTWHWMDSKFELHRDICVIYEIIGDLASVVHVRHKKLRFSQIKLSNCVTVLEDT